MGFLFHTALQRRFLSLLPKITTMKSVPAEGCAGIKAEQNYSFLTRERRGEICSRVFKMMLTAPLGWYDKCYTQRFVSLMVVLCIASSLCKKCKNAYLDVLFHMNLLRYFFHPGSGRHLPLNVAI